MPGLSKMKKSPNDTINLGFIGLGRQGIHLLNNFIKIPGVTIVAGCDVYGVKRLRFEKRVNEHYDQASRKKSKLRMYEKYQDLLAQKDIDAVIIATPDHWHALNAIDACKAGKDVYLEKPLTFTIREGQELVRAVRQNKRILSVGSQQRSYPDFQRAVKLVKGGKIGKLERINAYVGPPPVPYNLPEEPVPSDLNWDLWLGPSPYVHYNPELNPPISLNPPVNEKIWGGWRWYKELGGGYTTDFGAHMFDIAQWAMNMDNSGPARIIPAGYQDFDYMTFEYANGVVMSERPWNEKKSKGIKFWGSDGWIEITREFFNVSDNSLISRDETGIVPSHRENFIEDLRNRQEPIAAVEAGHRTSTTCTLGNIAHELQRPLRWDPEKEEFINDAEAGKHLHRPYREGYSLA